MKKIISAELFLINNKYYLRAYSTTTVGMGTARGNPIYIMTTDQLSTLGTEILRTFKDCKMDVPHPNFQLKQPKSEMLAVTGIKTDKELMKTGKSVGVYLNGEQIEIHPMYFNGKYLTCSPDRYMYCSTDPDDITKTVLAAFERCHP